MEVGLRQAQTRQSRTRRRPIMQDYAAAKDAAKDAAFGRLRRDQVGNKRRRKVKDKGEGKRRRARGRAHGAWGWFFRRMAYGPESSGGVYPRPISQPIPAANGG